MARLKLEKSGPGTDLDLSRDGPQYFEWLVEPSLYLGQEAQNAIDSEISRINILAHGPPSHVQPFADESVSSLRGGLCRSGEAWAALGPRRGKFYV